MFSNDPIAVRAAILAGTLQQVQAEPIRQTSTVRSTAVRGSLAGHSSSGAAVHRRVY
ncbi:MAG: hypothetical protein IPL41_15615 [Micropruina sp.]|nr:hypothetical protein [Micropruina sp.]